MKTLIKPLAWTIILTGWLFYVFIIWVTIAHPRPETNPITDFQENLHDMHKNWRISLFILIAIIVYSIAWAYIKETKNNHEKNKEK